MKKLLIATIGLGIALGTISTSFAQDTEKKEGKKKKKKDGDDKKVPTTQAVR